MTKLHRGGLYIGTSMNIDEDLRRLATLRLCAICFLRSTIFVLRASAGGWSLACRPAVWCVGSRWCDKLDQEDAIGSSKSGSPMLAPVDRAGAPSAIGSSADIGAAAFASAPPTVAPSAGGPLGEGPPRSS
jgi:hypothetical protein